MGVWNFPDIFQEKTNEIFHGIEFIRKYIDDLLIISVIATLSSNKVARGHVYKEIIKTSKTRCDKRSKWIRMGSTLFWLAKGKNESNNILKWI